MLIDERIRAGEAAGQLPLLGSAAPDLLRQSGESLAGRIAYVELAPLDVREAGGHMASRLWVRGGFPPSFLAESDWQSAEWAPCAGRDAAAPLEHAGPRAAC